MSKQIPTYQLIEKYLEGALSDKALSDFEKRMDLDHHLKSYVNEHKAVNKLIAINELVAIKQKLNQIHIEHKKTLLKRKLSLMIVVALISFIIIYLFINVFDKVYIDTSNKSTEQVEIKREQIKVQKPTVSSTVKKSTNLGKDIKTTDFTIEKLPNNLYQEKIDTDTMIDLEYINQNIGKFDSTVFKNRFDSAHKEDESLFVNADSIIDLKPEIIEEPCLDFDIESGLTITPSCENAYDGQIKLTSVEDNYTYSINGVYSVSKTGFFKHLKPALYTIHATNDKGCKSNPLIVQVETKICDFIIQPSQQKYWEIPLEKFQDEYVTLEIYSGRTGQQVFKTELDKFSNPTWDGSRSNGSILPMGSYVYLLTSRGYQLKGNITIVR